MSGLISFLLLLLFFSYSLIYLIVLVIANIVHGFNGKTNINYNLVNCIALSLIFTIGTFYKKSFGEYFLNQINAPKGFHESYKKIMKIFNMRVIIYFLAFSLVILSSIETFYKPLFNKITIWKALRPVINQSVLTFLAFERFVKEIKPDEKIKRIKNRLKEIKDLFNGVTKNDIKKGLNKFIDEM